MRSIPLALSIFLVGCLAPSTDPPDSSSGAQLFASFLPPVVVDPGANGTEPGLLAARDGSLYVVSVLGSATVRGDGLWKSTDGGLTWAFLGLPDYPFGGGDADLAEDDAGTLYLSGQWRPAALPGYYVTGGESMAVSKDGGRTWTVNPVASDLPVTDRQWVATYETGIVYLAFNQAQRGLVVTKSTDSGSSWPQVAAVPGTWDPGDGLNAGGANGIPGNILVDPADGTLLIPYAAGLGGGSREHRLFLSKDGLEFEARLIHRVPGGKQASAIFGSLDLDRKGNLYYAWAEGHEDTVRVFYKTSKDRGLTWSPAWPVSPADHAAIFPWLVAGEPGKVAVAYYDAAGRFLSDRAPASTPWHPTITILPDALNGPADAQTRRLSEEPNHVGPICTGGTGCDPKYRRLGDFFEIGMRPDGKVVAVWADDRVGNKTLNVFAHQGLGSLV